MNDAAFSARGGVWIFDRRLEMPVSSNYETDRCAPIADSRGRGGYNYATWPFGKLRATCGQLSITSVFFKPHVVTHANLVSITPLDYLPALGRGLRFEVDDREEATVFWTYRRTGIVRELASLGWTVEQPPA